MPSALSLTSGKVVKIEIVEELGMLAHLLADHADN